MYRVFVALFAVIALGCRESPEANLESYLRKGKVFAAKKDYSRAVIEFRNASQSMPNAAEPYYQLGMINSALGNMPSASEFLSRAVSLDPKHVGALIARSDLLIRSVHPAAVEEGKRLAQQALAISPTNVKALNLIALADLRAGKAETAAAQLKDLMKRFPDDPGTSINLARVLVSQNNRRGAEELLRNTAANLPQNAAALFALGDFYVVSGASPKAVEWYVRGLQLEPDNAQALSALGRLYADAGRAQEADDVFAWLARNPDRRFRYAYAIRLSATGRKTAAAVEYSRILKEIPENVEARTHLIDSYIDSGQFATAEELLAKAISASPRDADALTQRARLQLSRGQIDAAALDLEKVLEYRPESAQAHDLMAQVYRARQNQDLQQQELSEALRLDPRYSAARLALSQSLIRSDPQRALTLIDSAPEDQRQTPDLRIQRIWPLLELKRLDQARAAIDSVAAFGSSEVMLQDAVLHMFQKDWIGARTRAEKALAANPADVRALELIMRCAVGSKQPSEGIGFIRRHATQNRNLAAVQMFLGSVELQTGNVAQARATFETAKAAAPDIRDADWALIDLDITEGHFDDARHRIVPLMHGSTEALATAKLALVEQTARNYESACQHYRRVLQWKPFDAGILNALAYILAEFIGNPAEALRYAQMAKQVAPDNAAVDDTLGLTYYLLGRYSESIRHLELSARRAPTALRDAHLAMAYARYGDETRARQTLRAAMELDPDLPEVSQAQKVVAAGNPSSRGQ